MLQGPWKEASSPVVNLLVDDKNVNGEAISVALAYLYGHHPKLDDNNAFRVLAAATFLDLQVFLILKIYTCVWWFFSTPRDTIYFGPNDLKNRGYFLQDLCAICTDFIISELRTSNFLAYQVSEISVIYIFSTSLVSVNLEYTEFLHL